MNISIMWLDKETFTDSMDNPFELPPRVIITTEKGFYQINRLTYNANNPYLSVVKKNQQPHIIFKKLRRRLNG